MSDNKKQLLAAVPLGNTGSAFTYDRLVGIVEYLADTALLIAGTIAMGAVVYYGFMMTISKGDPGKFNEAKGHLIQAVIGAALIFGVYTVINTVQGAASSLTN
jgi:Type IV secretion system pilin